MAPAHATRRRPLVRRFHARIERGTQVIQPFGRDRSTEQGIAVPMELFAVNHGFRRQRGTRPSVHDESRSVSNALLAVFIAAVALRHMWRRRLLAPRRTDP